MPAATTPVFRRAWSYPVVGLPTARRHPRGTGDRPGPVRSLLLARPRTTARRHRFPVPDVTGVDGVLVLIGRPYTSAVASRRALLPSESFDSLTAQSIDVAPRFR